jgi:ribose transport system substrate-binding protein
MNNIAYFVQASPAYSYTVAQANAAVAEAKALGVNLSIHWDNLDPALELSGFQQAITSGKYGGIIIHPVNSQLCKPIATEAMRYQVLVEVVGNALCNNGSGSGAALYSPGTIVFMGGQNAVDGINTLLARAAQLSPGPQKVLLAMGTQGAPSVVAWQTAWKQFAATHPNWTLAGEIYTDYTTPTAFTDTQNFLNGNKGVTVIFSPYIDITVGVEKAVAAENLEKQIAVYENGGGSTAADGLVKGGQLKGDLPVYPESLGSQGVKVMVAAGKGVQPPRFIPGDGNPNATLGVITAANVGSFTPQW